MIDFAKLLEEDPAERAARRADEDAARREREIQDDIKRRKSWSRHTLRVTILEEPDIRSTRLGDPIAHINAQDETGTPVPAIYWIPTYYKHGVESAQTILQPGRTVTLKGYWKTRQWKNNRGLTAEKREFMVQFVCEPDSQQS